MPKANPSILAYETPAPRGALDPRILFWPIVAVLFVGCVLFTAGVGWASAVFELLTSFALLLVWLAAAYGWGLIPRLLLRINVQSPLGRVTTLATGLGTLSLLTLGLGLAGGMNQAIAVAITIIGLGTSVAVLLRHRMAVHLRVDFVHWWWLLLVPLAAFTITCAMLPAGFLWGMDEPNGYDVVSYHLQIPREWYELGRIVPLTHNVFSFMPFNVEMHYLFAMHLMGGPWVAQFLAQMMHAAFIGVSVAAVYAAVVERGQFPAIAAAVLAASAPWMSMLGSIAYNEGGMMLFGTLAIAWALRAASWREYALTGLLAGFGCGCKLTGVPILLIGLPAIVLIAQVIARTFSLHSMGQVMLLIAVGLLAFSPWLIRNAVWADNPVFPEQQKLLGRAHFTQAQSDRFYRAHKPRPDQAAMSARIAEFGRQVFADYRFGFALIPLGMAAMLFSIRRRESQVLLLLLLGLTLFWLLLTHLQGRFYVLAIPVSAMAIGFTAARSRTIFIGAVAIVLLLLGFGLMISRTMELSSKGDLMQAIGFAGWDNSENFNKAGLTSGGPIALVGDASAFLYKVPMSRLYYRTVFDVDDAGAKTASEAWTRGLPDDQDLMLWIIPSEIERFHRTYGTVGLNESFSTSGMVGNPFTLTSVRPAKRSPSPATPASAPSP